MQHKTAIRKHILSIRKGLSPEALQANANAITTYILAQPTWQSARQVLLYMPIANEVDTTTLVQKAWATGKQVLLPRCDAHEKGIMHVALCRSMDELRRGAYGILEPDPALCPSLMVTGHGQSLCPHSADAGLRPVLAPDLALIPAVAFDPQGNRLGYGGGYYDRFLAHEAMAKTQLIGLAHHAQIVSALPSEPWDRRMHAVCTEQGIIAQANAHAFTQTINTKHSTL